MDVNRKKVNREALEQLLEQTRLPENEVASRFKKALAPAYWEELNPYLSVDGDAAHDVIEMKAIDLRRQNELAGQFVKEGYFQTEPIISNSIVTHMRECVERLKKEDWPPVFAFVYDEFWLVTMPPSLVQLLSTILSPGYKRTSNIWAYYVNPRSGAKGWPPHIDGNHKGKRVTVWIPISDATLDNGCMYLIPQHLVPEKIAYNFGKLKTVSATDLTVLLQSSRALPAPAGAVLCWDYGIIHWGSTCGQARNPRISIGFSFIGEHTEPTRGEPPLFNGHSTLPTFAQRLHMIGKGILTYQFREPLMIKYLELARRLVGQVVV